ncbi:Uncharacterised protein [Mycobacteroides abscessus subsp. abscessus]|nr:Uncharacterised protein [Mycobacteroides abscessus subsp. abscessus]
MGGAHRGSCRDERVGGQADVCVDEDEDSTGSSVRIRIGGGERGQLGTGPRFSEPSVGARFASQHDQAVVVCAQLGEQFRCRIGRFVVEYDDPRRAGPARGGTLQGTNAVRHVSGLVADRK